jgi:hypothetical protein
MDGLKFTPSIYAQVVEQEMQHSSHASDLYVPVNPQTMALVKDYRFRSNVTTFVSQIDRKLWYDIPFAYMPFWEAKQKVS